MSENEPTSEDAAEVDTGRRRFLKFVAAGGTVAVVGAFGSRFLFEKLTGIPEDARHAAPGGNRSWVMLIDLKRCDGCGVCTSACSRDHNVPSGQEWIKVYEMKDENGASYFLPRPCMHCENAPCASVCPVGATFIRQDGLVLVDHNRCIGCRYCMAACPYNARYFNWGGEPELTPEQQAAYSPDHPIYHRRGTVEKCTFCAHRAEEGRLPACAEACPMKAIFFGDAREDAVSNGTEVWRLSTVLRERGGFRFKDDLGTKPRVFYLPARRE